MDFLCTSATISLPAAGLFSRSRPRGTREGGPPRVHYPRRKYGSRPGSRDACSGLPKVVKLWTVIAGKRPPERL